MKKVVLLRVGIDSDSGGIQGPLFRIGSFDFVPIPDDSDYKNKRRVNQVIATYGNTLGIHKRRLIEYFPERRQNKYRDHPIHQDPEFDTFTYGDPTRPKAGLRKLEPGDLLVFYAGLEGWGGFKSEPGLYIIGYFEVLKAGRMVDFAKREIQTVFGKNAHVKNERRFKKDKATLVLVKGSKKSRLLKKAVLISEPGKDCKGRPLKVLSKKMQAVFGNFDGKISIQRSPPRWVYPAFVDRAAQFVKRLR